MKLPVTINRKSAKLIHLSLEADIQNCNPDSPSYDPDLNPELLISIKNKIKANKTVELSHDELLEIYDSLDRGDCGPDDYCFSDDFSYDDYQDLKIACKLYAQEVK